MRKRILWLMLSFLLVAALVLGSCAEAVPGEQEEEEEEEEEEGLPQRGGTLTVLLRVPATLGDPPSPDMAEAQYTPTCWLSGVLEHPLMGDFEKYGPRGTGEYAFQLKAYIPDEYLTGMLLESWEIDDEKTTWNVRPGIHWAADNVDWMGNRELTAQDMVEDLLIFRDCAAGGWAFRGMTEADGIYATDRYTLVIETPGGFDLTMMYIIGYEDRSLFTPPEMEVAGPGVWANQVGTGPFMLKEYVVGSHMTYERNPNYWDTTTIDGVEYQIPFVDEMIYPMIPDPSSLLAALRTGEADFCGPGALGSEYWSDLDQTAGLLSARYPVPEGQLLGLKVTQPPFDNLKVRQALMIGTDMGAFAALADVGALPKHWFPLFSGDPSVYTPLEELPAEIQLLYDYNPTLARQMLDDANIPVGFEMNCVIASAPPASVARGALLVDMWDKIGIKVDLEVTEVVAFQAYATERDYKDSLLYGTEVGNPITALTRTGKTGDFYNWPVWSNDRFDELMDMMVAEADSAERNLMAKEAALLLLEDVPFIPLATGKMGQFWWPWVKNYYGESNVFDDSDISAVLARIWIDQDLKTEMGY